MCREFQGALLCTKPTLTSAYPLYLGFMTKYLWEIVCSDFSKREGGSSNLWEKHQALLNASGLWMNAVNGDKRGADQQTPCTLLRCSPFTERLGTGGA